MVSTTLRLVRRPFDLVFRPSAVVKARSTYGTSGFGRRLSVALRQVGLFVANLLLYTVPLSLSGIGSADTFPLRLLENSLFLFVTAALTFGAFHVGVFLAGQSRGVLTSIRVVTYSTALYLATVFTLVWYTATSRSVEAADDLLLFIQARFVNAILDWMGSDLVLPGSYPTSVETGALTLHGRVALVALVVLAAYYFYVLYLGARLAHDASRIAALFVIGFVALSPALYVAFSILAVELTIEIPSELLL